MGSPCKFDHNGECLICDCWISECAYDRMLNKDYKYESKEELEEMFKDITNRIMFGKLLKTEKGNYVLIDDTKGTYDKGFLIGTSRDSDVNKLSIKNCESIANGYDLDELLDGLLINRGEHFSRVRNPLYGEERQLAKDLVQKALEIINEARTHKDPQLIDSMSLRYRHDFGLITDESQKDGIRTIMHQLWEEVVGLGFYDGPTQWNVEIEMEPYHDGEFIDDGKTHVVEPKWRPALDADGCLILKRI